MTKCNSEFYTVGTYKSLQEAEIICSLLKANSVNTQVLDSDMPALQPLYSSDLGVKLIANYSDKEQIENILKSKFDITDFKKETE